MIGHGFRQAVEPDRMDAPQTISICPFNGKNAVIFRCGMRLPKKPLLRGLVRPQPFIVHSGRLGHLEQHIIQRLFVEEKQSGRRKIKHITVRQQIAYNTAVLNNPSVLAAEFLLDILVQAETVIAPVQTTPKNGIAALVGLECLVLTGNDIGALFPGVSI